MQKLNKTAIVTGASSDIGSVLVRELLSAEYTVYGQIHSNFGALKGLESNANLKVIPHDLSTSRQAEKFVQSVVEQSGRLDVLINAIGPMQHKSLSEVTPDEWDQQILFNLNLPFYMTHYAKEHLIRTQGHVVNFTFAGVESQKAWVNSTAFSSAKVGLVVLTKSWASILAPHRVRVNAISPGLIEVGDAQTEERKGMSDQIPYGRPGTPDEVAQVLMWLLKGSPSYLTGALIPIAGAWEYL